MINPDSITNYNRSAHELEEFLLFCIAVAGHNAHTTSKTLEAFLHTSYKVHYSPFEYIRAISAHRPFGLDFEETLRLFRFGTTKKLSKSFCEIAASGINLADCTIPQLEGVFGIGPKTARFFVLHSRPNQHKIAVLDTHVLKYMSAQGFKTPKSTPSGRSYLKLETQFLNHAKELGITDIASFDLSIWRSGRSLPSTGA